MGQLRRGQILIAKKLLWRILFIYLLSCCQRCVGLKKKPAIFLLFEVIPCPCTDRVAFRPKQIQLKRHAATSLLTSSSVTLRLTSEKGRPTKELLSLHPVAPELEWDENHLCFLSQHRVLLSQRWDEDERESRAASAVQSRAPKLSMNYLVIY